MNTFNVMPLLNTNDVVKPLNIDSSLKTVNIVINDKLSREEINRIDNDSVKTESIIYRFKFTEEFMEELYKFSKIHQYDDRHEFKDAWKVWTEDNDELIQEESCRLINLGYDGDILTKMFKSARYYFRKKSSEKKEPIQRRQYISINKELLLAMDNHIENKTYDKDYKPKDGFIEFCKENQEILKDSINKIYEQGIKDSHMIEDKIKKTYKNRYFIFITSRKQV